MDFPLPHPGPWLAGDVVARLGSARAPTRLVSGGSLIRISYGAYYEAQAWDGLSPEQQHMIVLTAHHAYHLRRGQQPGFVYSHLSADAARMLRPGQAQIVMDHGLRLGADRGVVRELVEAAAGTRGIPTARRAADLASADSESAAESLLNYLVAGMPFT